MVMSLVGDRDRMKRNADRKTTVSAPTEDGFLRRWSRQKTASRADAVSLPKPESPVDVSPGEPEPMLTDADMPPIESLTSDSDFSPFMSPGVSDELRRAALRRLFHAPAFNELCPLEGEFFDGHGYAKLGNIVTQEMRAQLEREALRLKAEAKNAIDDLAVDRQTSGKKRASTRATPDAVTTGARRARPGHVNHRAPQSKSRRPTRARKS